MLEPEELISDERETYFLSLAVLASKRGSPGRDDLHLMLPSDPEGDPGDTKKRLHNVPEDRRVHNLETMDKECEKCHALFW